MNRYEDSAKNFHKALAQVKETGEPVIIATQKNRYYNSDFTPTQLDIFESMEKMKSCDIIISINTNRTPGLFKRYFEKFKIYFKQIFRSLFKK